MKMLHLQAFLKGYILTFTDDIYFDIPIWGYILPSDKLNGLNHFHLEFQTHDPHRLPNIKGKNQQFHEENYPLNGCGIHSVFFNFRI